jgi:hypothetical protein
LSPGGLSRAWKGHGEPDTPQNLPALVCDPHIAPLAIARGLSDQLWTAVTTPEKSGQSFFSLLQLSKNLH